MSRTKRSAFAFFSGLGSSVVTLLIGLMSTPVLLRFLGDERAGTFRIATEWLGYLALMDFGLGGVLQATVARRLGHNETSKALADVRRAMRLFARVALLQLAALFFFGLTARWLISGLSTEALFELRMGLLVSAIGTVWVPLAALRPLLDGAQRSYWVNAALLVQSLGTVGLSILFAWWGWGLTGQFTAALLGSAAYTFFLFRLVSRVFPDVWRPLSDVQPDKFPPGWPMFMFNLVGRFSIMSDGIILGAIQGPGEVVRFYVTQRLMLVVVSQVQGIGNATWAALADLHHRGESDIFRHRFLQLNRWTAILAVAGLGPLAVLNERLISLWVGISRYGGDALTWATFGQALLVAQVALWAWPLVGGGMVKLVLPVMFVGSILNLILSIVGTYILGLVGPSLGTFAGYLLVYYWWYPRLLQKEFGLSRISIMSPLLLATALFTPIGCGLWSVSQYFPNGFMGNRIMDFFAWGMMAGTGGVIYLCLAWKILIPLKERQRWPKRLSRR